MQDPLSAGLIVLLLSPLSVNRALLCSDDMLSHLAWSSSGPTEVAWSLSLMATKCSSIAGSGCVNQFVEHLEALLMVFLVELERVRDLPGSGRKLQTQSEHVSLQIREGFL